MKSTLTGFHSLCFHPQLYMSFDNMKNPYKDNKNDEPNNATENIEYQNAEKEDFSSQFSIQSHEDKYLKSNKYKFSILCPK